MSRIEINGPYKVRQPHYVSIDNNSDKVMWPIVHSNNIGVGNAIAWGTTELAAISIADGLNVMCAIRNQKG